jgi:hypothetical protein
VVEGAAGALGVEARLEVVEVLLKEESILDLIVKERDWEIVDLEEPFRWMECQ